MKTNINYFQLVKQTDEEKLKMYMNLPKEDLAKMLIQANKLLNDRITVKYLDTDLLKILNDCDKIVGKKIPNRLRI